MNTMAGDPTVVVSVIIPAYNVTRFIRETLDSVLKQTFCYFEVIVVNDRCPDTTSLDLVLAPYLSKIIYIKHAHNCGLAAARNTGISAARGEFVALLDGDDLWEPSYLSRQIAMLRNNPDADVVYCDAALFGDTREAGKRLMELSPSNGPVTLVTLFRQDVQVTISVLARRGILVRVGLFDTSLRSSEDFDMWVRITKAGGNIVYHRERLFRYRKHAGSLSSDNIRMSKGALIVARKTLQREDLSYDERVAVQEATERWTADLTLARGKRCFVEGDYKTAYTLICEANRFHRRWKLRLVGMGVRWVPGFLRLLRQMRSSN